MACGTPVVASDLLALREVGGDAATYCPVGDVDHWINSVADLLRERVHDGEGWRIRRAAGTAQARRFNWPEHARRMTVYRERWPRSWPAMRPHVQWCYRRGTEAHE